jgi:hypothetical protein
MNADIRILLRAASVAPSADNSQPWCFSVGERMFSVAFDKERAGDGFFGPTSPATLLAVGALLENIRETARGLNMDIEVEDLIDSPTAGFPYLRVHLREAIEREIPEDLAVFARHTNRFAFHSRAIESRILRSIASLQEAQAQLRIISEPAKIKRIAKLLTWASEMRFQIKEIHLWLIDSLRFNADEISRGDGLDVNTLLLPPGGKAFLRLVSNWQRMETFNRFAGDKLMAREEAKLVAKAPTLIAVTAPRDNAGLLAAGLLMARAWIALNTNKVAVHPYYVISDQLNRLQEGILPTNLIEKAKALQKGCQQVFTYNEHESIHMLLRVGYPKLDPQRSRRLPLEALIKQPSTPAVANHHQLDQFKANPTANPHVWKPT